MTAGLAPTYADQLLDTVSGSSFTPPAATWAQLHTGDPGIAGTANVSSVTTRESVTWNAAGTGGDPAGTKTMSNAPSWGTWAGSSPETLMYLSFWDSVTGGVFLFSLQLGAPVTVVTGSPLTMPVMSVTFSQVAA